MDLADWKWVLYLQKMALLCIFFPPKTAWNGSGHLLAVWFQTFLI